MDIERFIRGEIEDDPILIPKSGSIFKAAKGDEVDKAIENILNRINAILPFIRLNCKDHVYLIGTKKKLVILKDRVCMVRIGGGFEKLEEYIAKH